MRVEESGESLNTFGKIKDRVVKQGKVAKVFLSPKKEDPKRLSLKLKNVVLFCCKNCLKLNLKLNKIPGPSIGMKILETEGRIFVICLLCFKECAIDKKIDYCKTYKLRIQKPKSAKV